MAITLKDMKLEISSDGTTWTDASGKSVAITIDGGDWKTEDLFVFGTDTATVMLGKREPVNVTVRVVYTETSSDPFETVRTAYEAGNTFYVRWSPKGGASGDKQYQVSGPVISFDYPGGEASDANPVLVEFTIRASSISTNTVV